MELLDIITKAAMDFDSTFQKVTMERGPGSDGPFVQAEYYALITLADGTRMRLGMYHKNSINDYHFPIWGSYNPPTGLLEKLNEALSKETDLKSKTK